jgi:tetratricopeptide (TPR) repeat protein
MLFLFMNSNHLSIAAGLLMLFTCHSSCAQENLPDQFYSGNFNRVIQLSSESLANGDTAFHAFYFKALSEVELGLTGDAVLTLQQAHLSRPDDIRILRLLAGQYSAAGDYLKAHDLYARLVRMDSTDVTSWLKLAEISLFRQQYGKACEALRQVLLIDSLNLPGLMMVGDILNKQNDRGAAAYYEHAFRLYPDNQKAAYALSNWYIQNKKAREAIHVCEHMLDIDSSSVLFHKLIGYAYYKSGDPQQAIRHFEYAADAGDSTAFTFKFMGISRYLAVDFQKAIESLLIAAEKDSTDAEVHFFLGASMATTRDKKGAMFHLQKAMGLMQPDPSVVSRIYSEQGNIQRLLGDYGKAYSFYNMAWETDSHNLMALYYMASILDNSLHRSKEALVDYQRFIDQLDMQPETGEGDGQIPTIRAIVEERITSLREELFFLDQQ